MAKSRARRGRLRRMLGWTAVAAVALPVVVVLVLRWVPPPTSSIMVQRTLVG